MKDSRVELRAAAARLMYNDNRDIRDYYLLIDFIDGTFNVMNQISNKIDKIRGMDIIFVTTAKTDEEAKALLELLGMPFSK